MIKASLDTRLLALVEGLAADTYLTGNKASYRLIEVLREYSGDTQSEQYRIIDRIYTTLREKMNYGDDRHKGSWIP